MKSVLITLLVLHLNLLSQHNLLTQHDFKDGAGLCSYIKSNSRNFAEIYSKSSYGSNHSFDALEYKLFLNLYDCYRPPFTSSFKANLILKFKADSLLNLIKLNADNNSLVIDSVKLSGVSYTHNNNILTINLDRNYNPGETADIQIFYGHNNVYDSAFYNITGVVLTDCEPFGARKWFPCWDKPNDKATIDLTAKVPLIVKLGSNGRLNDSTVTGDTIYYHWVSRDPAPTYAMSIVSRPYYNLDILYWHKLSNPSDSIPIRIYWNYGENPDSLNNVKSIILPMTDLYSVMFTEHPFEKNGFASPGQPLWGMENQTLTTLGSEWWEIGISHEFAHQWFGDMITCGTWADIWLNEGFATYCDALWIEHKNGYISYKSVISNYASFVFTYPTNLPIYNPSWINNPPPKWMIFNGTLSYYKPACVLSMLRYVTGDSTFFRILKAYASDNTYKYKNVITTDFIQKVNLISGQNYDWFFDQWIYKPNHPKYQNTYNIILLDSTHWKVQFTAKQVQTNPPFFKMPVVLKIFLNGPDTTIKVMNDINNQLFEFTFDRQAQALLFDPNNDIVLKEGTTTIGIINTSSEIPVKYNLFQNYPNPFNLSTIIKFDISKTGFTKLVLYDIQGREIKPIINQNLYAGSYKINFDASNLSSGVYFYRIKSGDFIDSKKFVVIK